MQREVKSFAGSGGILSAFTSEQPKPRGTFCEGGASDRQIATTCKGETKCTLLMVELYNKKAAGNALRIANRRSGGGERFSCPLFPLKHYQTVRYIKFVIF